MVDYMTLAIAITSGLGVYLVAIPFTSFFLPPALRKTIGDFYASNAARLLEQFTYVRRVLSGYDILTIDVDAEKKLLEVTLEGTTLPGKADKTFRFSNPDDRIKRLFKKPVALAYEQVPAAIDAELAEVGHWVREKDTEEGLNQGEKVDPYVPMPDGLHIADPLDAYELIPNSVTPENITTTERLTERRFEKYGTPIGLREGISTAIGFAVGSGVVMFVDYFKKTLLHDSGSGPEVVDIGLGMIVDIGVLLA